jgi:hypothetical protein
MKFAEKLRISSYPWATVSVFVPGCRAATATISCRGPLVHMPVEDQLRSKTQIQKFDTFVMISGNVLLLLSHLACETQVNGCFHKRKIKAEHPKKLGPN